MGRLAERHDGRALRRRIRHMRIAPDKRTEGRAILAEMKRILKALSDERNQSPGPDV